MLLVLLRGASTISDGQALGFTIFFGLLMGLIFGAYFHSKFPIIKSFFFSLLTGIIICSLISFWDLAFAIGTLYGTLFGIILSLGIGHFGNK